MSQMIPLPSQEFLEELIKKDVPHDPVVVIKFGATWCEPCKRIDKNILLNLSDQIKWYECDIDENDYTPGYCGVKKIPSFLAILNGIPQPILQCSDTMKVAEWLKSGCKAL
jgi:thioredoxin 1